MFLTVNVQTRGMYIIFWTKNFFSKEYLEPKDVRNVRKWPNLSSVSLEIFGSSSGSLKQIN